MKYISSIWFLYKITTVVCDFNNNDFKDMEAKIVQGEPVDIDKYPHAVMFYNNDALCSGSIISSWTVLTAAHCFDINKELENMRIIAGSTFGKEIQKKNFYYVAHYIVHEHYNKPMRFAADIAVLFVEKEFVFSRKIQKTLIVDHIDWMKARQLATVVGWGWTQPMGMLSKGLMRAILYFVPKEECEKLHKLSLSEDMFCLYGDGQRDSCKGDSGGGATWKRYLIGIVSHGRGCAVVDKPSVYISAWYHRTWIQQKIDEYYSLLCRNRNGTTLNRNLL